MSNKLRDIFMPHLKWLDKSIIDANPCNTCPIHEEYMEKALHGSVAERQYAEHPDSCPCYKKLLWDGECLSKLEWYESQDKRLHPELLEEPKQSWISVKDKLPENDVRVLVFLNSKRSYTETDTDRMHAGEWVRWGNDVTHWMPLPEPPKEDCHGQTANSEM